MSDRRAGQSEAGLKLLMLSEAAAFSLGATCSRQRVFHEGYSVSISTVIFTGWTRDFITDWFSSVEPFYNRRLERCFSVICLSCVSWALSLQRQPPRSAPSPGPPQQQSSASDKSSHQHHTLPANTSPGSSTAPPSGSNTTLSPSTTTSGVTNHTTLTHSTEPTSGKTTASSTTTPTSTTPTPTISTVTTFTGTTLRPTDITTKNSTTTPISTTTTISTGTTIPGTTLRPTDITTNNSTTTPISTTTTISTGTTFTGTTLRPTDITTNNSTTTPISTTTTISTGSTITGITLRPTDITTNNSTTAAPSLPPVIVCPAVSCPPESICLNGTCQCLSGSFLMNDRCAPAQVFPGQLHITSLTFNNEMSNRSSAIFQQTAANISAALRDALKDLQGYKQSDVVQLEPGSVQATVNNIFENTIVTQESVDQAIKNAKAANGLLANASFTATNLCEQTPLPCDISTTICRNTSGRAVCSCKKGYISLRPFSINSCRACPSGSRAVGDMCQPCAFGYAGFNCNDSSLLAVVVISCVLGGVLLIIVLALVIYFCWRRCSKSKPDYSSSPYSSGDINQPWPTGITPIPRASSNCYEAPPIEMAEGASTRVLVDKNHQANGLGFQPKLKGWKKSGSYDLNPDAMHTFKGKNPSRYSYLVQGHENPYFLPGEDKRN
ncbi:hypothetical protein PFLUV_G00180040 [Perca fluviatilis]|uniref:SEA domain-containing protein n=1 Tax=Perca fluviatilis TaxID=8168 RepID=A0A6A5EG60_PERFL|nr:hypothetical protein PFLUV_G00180040 [Perca fluviatilis]